MVSQLVIGFVLVTIVFHLFPIIATITAISLKPFLANPIITVRLSNTKVIIEFHFPNHLQLQSMYSMVCHL